MTTIEAKVDAMARMFLGVTEEARNAARTELCRLIELPVREDKEEIIHEMLKDVGVPCGNLGHGYLVNAIELVVNDPTAINNITKDGGIYHVVAKQNQTTSSRVERAIRHLIEVTWSRGDMDVLMRYFGNTVSADKGKPTNGEFIARLANMVRIKLK